MKTVQEQARARFIGAKNRAQGEALEEQIEAACLFYRSLELADIEKTPEPMKVLKRLEEGQFLCCFEKKAQPDFQGTFSSGRSVMFDAKSTRTGRIHQDAVSDTQWEYLDRHQKMNALCFVLVSFGDMYAVVPWDDWKRMKELFGHKYMTRQEAEGYRVRYNTRGILDFLGWETSKKKRKTEKR